MDQIAFFFRELYIYWSSVLLLVAAAVAVFLFLALYLGKGGKVLAAFGVVPLAVLFSCFFARFIHWYCFSESYSGFAAAICPVFVFFKIGRKIRIFKDRRQKKLLFQAE